MQHALFVCPLYSSVRARFSGLVFEPNVHAFMEQDPVLVAAFVAECQRTHAAASADAATAAAPAAGVAAAPAPA